MLLDIDFQHFIPFQWPWPCSGITRSLQSKACWPASPLSLSLFLSWLLSLLGITKIVNGILLLICRWIFSEKWEIFHLICVCQYALVWHQHKWNLRTICHEMCYLVQCLTPVPSAVWSDLDLPSSASSTVLCWQPWNYEHCLCLCQSCSLRDSRALWFHVSVMFS